MSTAMSTTMSTIPSSASTSASTPPFSSSNYHPMDMHVEGEGVPSVLSHKRPYSGYESDQDMTPVDGIRLDSCSVVAFNTGHLSSLSTCPPPSTSTPSSAPSPLLSTRSPPSTCVLAPPAPSSMYYKKGPSTILPHPSLSTNTPSPLGHSSSLVSSTSKLSITDLCNSDHEGQGMPSTTQHRRTEEEEIAQVLSGMRKAHTGSRSSSVSSMNVSLDSAGVELADMELSGQNATSGFFGRLASIPAVNTTIRTIGEVYEQGKASSRVVKVCCVVLAEETRSFSRSCIDWFIFLICLDDGCSIRPRR
jgi:hypothetical protein